MGLKEVDLAKRLKVDEMTIVNWELDKTSSRKDYIHRLKECLGIKT